MEKPYYQFKKKNTLNHGSNGAVYSLIKHLQKDFLVRLTKKIFFLDLTSCQTSLYGYDIVLLKVSCMNKSERKTCSGTFI
jgi:hypothetical protein